MHMKGTELFYLIPPMMNTGIFELPVKSYMNNEISSVHYNNTCIQQNEESMQSLNYLFVFFPFACCLLK